MATMLNVYDRETRKKTAVLQNAYNIIETHELNQIYTLSFTLPSTDEKTKYCLPCHYVRWGDDGELYRIKEPKLDESNIGTITYECEHVITTLCDSIMFGSFQYGGANVKTSAVISWLLRQQKTQTWTLGECDFDRKFEYLWEQENILNALYSIPKEFASPYKWFFDTTVYPWRISLKAINLTAKPEYYLRAKSNILASGTSADYANICTRIYPLGYGEGVNQLNIRSVNGNVPYLQSPPEIIAQYGIVEKVLVDRRFENAESLKAYAQTMLDLYQTPSMSRSFDVTDLYPLTAQSWDNAEVGKICKMTQDGTTAYITKVKRQWDKAGDLQIDLSTKATDIASSVADLADRIRIESVYAQGATQLYQHSKDANATPDKGMVMSLYFPSEMKQINKVLMRLKLNRFRSYSQTTEAGGSSTQTTSTLAQSTPTTSTRAQSTPTTSTAAQSTRTTSSIEQKSQTTSSGGATGQTETAIGAPNVNVYAAYTQDANWKNESSIPTSKTNLTDDYQLYTYSAGNHNHENGTDFTEYADPDPDNLNHNHAVHQKETSTDGWHSHSIYDPGQGHSHGIARNNLQHTHYIIINNIDQSLQGLQHSHSFSIGGHTHTVTIPGHDHTVTIPSHNHTVTIPSHNHTVTIPAHNHTVNIPVHTHNIAAGIFESGNATAFDIYVGNIKKTTVNATSYNGDITQWLLNNKNQVPRDQWIDITIVPNDLAYVVSSVFVQGFVQSRGGGNY